MKPNPQRKWEYIHGSQLEAKFAMLWRALEGPQLEIEYRFHPTRRWRFDFALPEKKIAIEIEGGTFCGGRHTRGIGHEKDCEKYNAAAAMGWRVFRLTTHMVNIPNVLPIAVESRKEP